MIGVDQNVVTLIENSMANLTGNPLINGPFWGILQGFIFMDDCFDNLFSIDLYHLSIIQNRAYYNRNRPEPTRTDQEPTRTEQEPTRNRPEPSRSRPEPTRTEQIQCSFNLGE